MMLWSLDWNALPARVSAFWVLSSGSVKKSFCIPNREQGQFSDCVVNDMQTSAAGLLDWNALPTRVSAFWVLSSGSVKKSSCCPNRTIGQVRDCVVNDMQTSAAGLSQCLIMDILNEVMQFGLECILSKGLCFLGFELWECEKVWLRSQLNKAKSVTVWSMTCKPVLLDCPNVSLWIY
eukprot:scaffold39963_cov61-Cyclotella_meneghiniana.AAC.2